VAWPAYRANNFVVDDTAWNEIVAALQVWGGAVDANGQNLTNAEKVYTRYLHPKGSSAYFTAMEDSGEVVFRNGVDARIRFNAGTVTGYPYLQSLNDAMDGHRPLRIGASRIELMDGFVGVNTSNPLNTFQVHVGDDENIGLRHSNSMASIGVFNDAGNTVLPLELWASYTKVLNELRVSNTADLNDFLKIDWAAQNGPAQIQAYYDSTQYANLVLNPLGGKVGIGTNPTSFLHVNGGGAPSAIFTNFASTSSNVAIHGGTDGGATSSIYITSHAAQWRFVATENAFLFPVSGGPMADGSLSNNVCNIWFDEGNNRLAFKCRTSGGVLKNGYLAVS
jgi:hypothetical protein